MQRLIFIFFLFLNAVAVCAASSDSIMERRAERSYLAGEWTSAQTLYNIVADRHPRDARAVARAITAGLMRGDSIALIPAVEKALSAGTPIDSLTGNLQAEALANGRVDLYEHTLLTMADKLAYLRRPVNARLLAFYRFRNDADNVIRYAGMMLAGVADDPRYLNPLAWAYAQKGNIDKAVETWRRVLVVEPDNIEALLSAGNALAATDPTAALPLLRRAAAIRPTPYLTSLIGKLQSSKTAR